MEENTEIPESSRMNVPCEKPLSPVLNNSKITRRLVMDRKFQKKKSRIKLADRFNESNANNKSETQEKVSSALLEDSFTPSQTDNILQSIEKLEQLKQDEKKVDLLPTFDFKVPVSPIACSKSSGSFKAGTAQMPLLNNDNFHSFQTAAGNHILLSKEKIKEHSKLFQDILNPDSNLLETRSNKYSFLSKSGLNKSQESKYVQNMPKNISENSKNEHFEDTSLTLNIPKTSSDMNDLNLLHNKECFDGNVNVTEVHKEAPTSSEVYKGSSVHCASDKPNFGNKLMGFKKASGKEINISEVFLKKAKQLFSEDFEDESVFNQSFKNVGNSNLQVDYGNQKEKIDEINDFKIDNSDRTEVDEGFKGYEQFVIYEFIQKAELFKERSEKYCNLEMNLQSSNSHDLKISGVKRCMTTEFDDLPTLKKLKSTDLDIQGISGNFKGFMSASGSSIKISHSSLNKAQHIFKDIDMNIDNMQSRCQTNVSKITNSKNSNVGFQTASGNKLRLTRNSLKKAESLFQDINNDCSLDKLLPTDNNTELFQNTSGYSDTSLSSNSYSDQKSRNKKRLGVSSCKLIQISKDKLDKAKLLFKSDMSLPSPITKSDQSYYCNVTPAQQTLSSSTPLKVATSNALFNTTITPIRNHTVVTNVEKDDPEIYIDSHMLIQKRTEGTIDLWSENLDKEIQLLKTKLKLLTERQKALSHQKHVLENGSANQKRTHGVLFLKKSGSRRISLQSLDCSKNELMDKYSSIAPKNALSVHFSCTEQAVVKTLDGAEVIPNLRNAVGLSEIEMAFKTMPGVEPKLIPSGWIQNHYKWIVWKLGSYDKFSSQLKGCLCIENVIQQLKYRYDREIDKAERPALRKIYEMDDVPQKRIVLCVADILKTSDSKFELELTDGWYSIRTVIDEPLSEQVCKGRIKIGTKLITCGAELLNCEGCYPLEATDLVHLKINCNSTRRAAWYLKLGYQPNFEPFPVRLNSVLPLGGVIGRIKVFIARVYPVRYLERQGKLTVWRNKKAEERRAQDWENEQLRKIEEIQEVVRKDYEKSKRNEDKKIPTNLSRDDIINITCPKTLYNLYENSRDPDALQELLSLSQKNAIIEYQGKVSFRKEEEINSKIKDGINRLQFSKRDVTPVLKFIVLDVLDQSNQSFIFQVWKPSDTHLQILKEGCIFNVYNVLPKKNGDLSSIARTKFKEEFVHSPRFDKYKRILFPIEMLYELPAKPFRNEIDTIGLVVQFSVNAFNQNLWLTDLSGRLLFIKIFEGPKNCCLLDKLKGGRVVAASNLIMCESKLEFAQAIANHSTIISSYPQHEHLQKGINKFNEQLPMDINLLLNECEQKILFYLDKFEVTKNNKNASSSKSLVDLNLVNASELDDSSEENTLVYSRITSTDVAMSLIDIDKLT